MVKHTLKTLQWSSSKIFKICFTVLQHYEIKDKNTALSLSLSISLSLSLSLSLCLSEIEVNYIFEAENSNCFSILFKISEQTICRLAIGLKQRKQKQLSCIFFSRRNKETFIAISTPYLNYEMQIFKFLWHQFSYLFSTWKVWKSWPCQQVNYNVSICFPVAVEFNFLKTASTHFFTDSVPYSILICISLFASNYLIFCYL